MMTEKHTVQIPDCLKSFKKSGSASVDASFSYCNSSASFCDSARSAGNKRSTLQTSHIRDFHCRMKRREIDSQDPSPSLLTLTENALTAGCATAAVRESASAGRRERTEVESSERVESVLLDEAVNWRRERRADILSAFAFFEDRWCVCFRSDVQDRGSLGGRVLWVA